MNAEFSTPNDYENELRGLRPDDPKDPSAEGPDFLFAGDTDEVSGDADCGIADQTIMTEETAMGSNRREAAMGSAAVRSQTVRDIPGTSARRNGPIGVPSEAGTMQRVEQVGDVVEGTVVGERAPNYYADVLANERKVNVVGDYAEEVDAATSALVLEHVARLNQEPGRSVVVVANFGPGATTQLIDNASENLGIYDLRASNVQGVPGLLTSEQFGDVLASAAAVEDSPAVASRYARLLGPPIAAIEAWKGGPRSNGVGNVGPQEVRDAIRLLGGASAADPMGGKKDSEVPNLPELDLRRAVRDSVNKTSLESNEAYLEPLRDFLDKSYPDSEEPHFAGLSEYSPGLGAEPAPAPAPGQQSVTSIIHLGVGGSGRRLDHHSAIVANALPPLLAEQTPNGRPELVVLANADLAPQQAVKQILRHCRQQRIRTIVTVAQLTDESAWLIQGGAYAWTQVNAAQAYLLSKAMGTTLRTRASGATLSSGTNTGVSLHQGSSVNFEGTHSVYAQSSGTSGSIDGSQGDNFGLQVNFQISEEARFYPHDIEEQVGPSQVGAVTSLKEPLGVSTIGGELVRPFPPPIADPPELAEIRAQMARVQEHSKEMLRLREQLAVYQQLAARQEGEKPAIAASDGPRQVTSSGGIPQGARPKTIPVAARTPDLQVREWRLQRANEVTHGRSHGSLRKFIQERYKDECARKGVEPTRDGYRAWVEPYERYI